MPLNPSQTKAVTCEGFQLVLAGPGSGKTRVITEKILRLLDQGIPANQILALTFSEKAAAEMSERIEQSRPNLNLEIHTFHSFCLQLMKENVLASGISVSGRIISKTTQLVWGLRNIDAFGLEYIRVGNNAAEVVNALIEGISAFRDELVTPALLADYLGRKKTADVSDEEREYLDQLSDLLKVYRAYEQYKRDERLIDFDDMIHGAVNLLRSRATVRSAYRNRFRYILVDEFQDTNFAQLELIKELAGDHLCVVGDDDQTIYRFRGAYLTNIRDFKEWAAQHAEILLDENYRNSPAILSLAMQLMKNAPNRQEKKLFTRKPEGEPVTVAACGNEDGEAEYVAQEIARLAGTKYIPHRKGKERELGYRDFAILCRSWKDGAKFQAALRRHTIPCEYQADVDFLRLPVIRDLVAYLQIIDNPLVAGVALNRILKLCAIPETVVQKINAAAGKKGYTGARKDPEPGNDFVYETMLDAESVVPGHAPAIAGIVRMLRHFIEEKERHTLPQLVYEVMMQASGLYRSALNGEAAQTRQYLAKFFEITQEYDRITRQAAITDFLEYLRFFSAFTVDIEEREESNAVRIITAHKSKGKEFSVVFVADLAANRFPLRYREKTFVVPADLARGLRSGDDEKALFIQEERRLLYVAMTRAEERLYVTYAKWYGGNKRETKPSQFLEELTFRTNPLITVTEPPAQGADLPVPDTTPVEELKTSLQEQAIRAIADMRLSTALQNLVTLERVREYAERGTDVFDKDTFVATADTDIPVADLISAPPDVPVIPESLRFSASALQKYQDCPLQYKFASILKIPEPPGVSPAAAKGTSVHSVIEHLDLSQPVPEQIPKLLEQFWTPEQFESVTQSEQDKASAYDLIQTYLAWQAKNNNTILESEKEFSFTLAGREMHGFIDRIEQTPRGGYEVIDFKTGSSKSSGITKKNLPENIQLNLYAMAIRELYGKLPERTTLFYLADNKLVDYAPTEAGVKAFTENLEKMVARILAGEFPAQPGYKQCEWCPYGDLCGEREIGEE